MAIPPRLTQKNTPPAQTPGAPTQSLDEIPFADEEAPPVDDTTFLEVVLDGEDEAAKRKGRELFAKWNAHPDDPICQLSFFQKLVAKFLIRSVEAMRALSATVNGSAAEIRSASVDLAGALRENAAAVKLSTKSSTAAIEATERATFQEITNQRQSIENLTRAVQALQKTAATRTQVQASATMPVTAHQHQPAAPRMMPVQTAIKVESGGWSWACLGTGFAVGFIFAIIMVLILR